MSLLTAVVETFTTTVPQEQPVTPVDNSPAPSLLPEKSSEHLLKVFEMGKALYEAKREPLSKERARLQAEVQAEQAIVDEAEHFDIESSELSREDLTSELMRLETAARIAKQMMDKKQRELDAMVDKIEKLRTNQLKTEQHLRKVAEKVADSRRAAVIDFTVDGMHEHKLSQRSAVLELKLAERLEVLMADYCQCPETAKLATDECCAISLPTDSRLLYWEVLSRRSRADNPELDPTNQPGTTETETNDKDDEA